MGSFRRARRAHRRADSYRDELTADVDLRPGDAIVSGRVAYAEGATEAMRVELLQEGEERENSGSWTHRWTEISRRLTVHPFYLLQDLRSGEGPRRVRVEPTRDSQLFDALDGKILVSTGPTWRRERSASLVPDERVWVVGRLARDVDPEAAPRRAGYRENAHTEGWVLRGAPTLVVSSVPLVDHFRQRAQMHLEQALVCLLLLAVPVGLLAMRLDREMGTTVTGTVTAVSVWTNVHTDEDSREETETTHYEATVRALGKVWTSEALGVEPAVGDPFRLRVGNWSSNDGDDVHWRGFELGTLLVGILVATVLRIVLAVYSRRQLPWFRSKKPHVERGSGRLTA